MASIFLLRESCVLRDGSSAVMLPPVPQTDICPAHFCALGLDVHHLVRTLGPGCSLHVFRFSQNISILRPPQQLESTFLRTVRDTWRSDTGGRQRDVCLMPSCSSFLSQEIQILLFKARGDIMEENL